MADERVKWRLAAILSADVVGYGRLMENDEVGTFARLKSLRAELIDPKIAEGGGRIFKTMGDGVLAEFPSVVMAVECAVEIQTSMAKRNADEPDNRRMEFRIGVNHGDVIIDGDDIQGDGVNVASRMEGLAEPGGVYVTGKVYDEARNKLEIEFEDLGQQRVKNISKPVQIYRVVLDGGGPAALTSPAESAIIGPGHPPLLPQDLPDFAGRTEIVARLRDLLESGRGAVVTAIGGMGGLGKTVLAVHVGHIVAPQYPDGQILVRLAGASGTPLTAAAAMTTVIRSLASSTAPLPETLNDLQPIYLRILLGKKVLLILDDASNSAQIESLRPPISCGVIVTSRGTVVLPGLDSIDLDLMTVEEAQSLLQSAAGPDRATKEELQRIADICGFLPLALRVAGTFLRSNKMWSGQDYIKALSNERQRLKVLALEKDMGKGLDVPASLSLSVDQLHKDRPELVTFWRLLSVFPADFDRAAAAAVWNVTDDMARDTLQHLMNHALILYDQKLERSRLHDLMRDLAVDPSFLRNEIADPDIAEKLHAASLRFARHYLDLDVIRSSNLDVELPNFIHAVHWSYDNEEWETLSANVLALDNLIRRNGYWIARSDILAVALDVAEKSNDWDLLSRLRDCLGIMAFHQGNFPRAKDCFQKNLQLSRDRKNLKSEAAILHSLGRVAEALDEYRNAKNYYRESIKIARKIDDSKSIGPTLHELGVVAFRMRDYKEAKKLYEEALETVRDARDRNTEAATLHAMGLLSFREGNIEEAELKYDKSLEIKMELNNLEEIARTLLELSYVYEKQNKLKEAQSSLVESEEIFRRMHHRYTDKAKWRLEEINRKLDNK